MVPIESILLVTAGLLFLSVVASLTSGRLGVPALLVFLVIGMLAGSEGPGGFAFDDPWLAQSLGIVALSLILFAGGLDTDWPLVRPVGLLRGPHVGGAARDVDPGRGPVARTRRADSGARAGRAGQAVGSPRGRLVEILVGPRSRVIGRRILDLGLPKGSLVVLLKRGEEVVIPDGGTELSEGDRLTVLADEQNVPGIRAAVENAEDEPPGG